ncbi:MAG TPA: hypothetical protein VFE31_00755 [Opitutaceae bacterium]|jgi:hypothetical protein|nr:hypothetical protein [Opitutaceae bacterium]
MKRLALVFLALAGACAADELATYNTAGALTSLIWDGTELPVQGEFQVGFSGRLTESAQPHEQRSEVFRTGRELNWHGVATYPDSAASRFEVRWTEDPAGGVTLHGALTAGNPAPGMPAGWRFPVPVDSVDYVVDVPREPFLGGRLLPSGQTIASAPLDGPVLYTGQTASVAFVDAAGNWKLTLTTDRALPITVTDRWDAKGRSFRVRLQLHSGPWMQGDVIPLTLAFKLTGRSAAPAAALSVDPAERKYPFAGFGGDFRIYTPSPVADYMLEHLHVAWARTEFKASLWDRERGHPGAVLQRDFALMQRLSGSHIPWVLSLWSLPESYYTNPNRVPFYTFGRTIAPDRWPAFLDLLTSYLGYLKSHYGAEPDLFSFNEPDLGVNIGFDGETHREAIRRIGARLAADGFKTKLLLGDTANPRGSYLFTLPTAADPGAMRYVGALSFHSWGNGTPEQYADWGDVAEWARRPLLVAEAGVDPGAYRNAEYDSFAYGLSEMRQYQQLLRYARPAAILYWQFTDDYSLVHVSPAGRIEPTGRYWMMRQFTNLTPDGGSAVASASDQPDVLISAFANGSRLAVHILNAGPARTATLSGLPEGHWQTMTTTESAGDVAGTFDQSAGGPASLALPARALVTLYR